MKIISYLVTANVESNRPNTEVLLDTDNIDHAREVKTLLESLKSGYDDGIDDMIETMKNLKVLKEEFGINIFTDINVMGSVIDDKDYIPEVTCIKILEVKEI